MRKIKEVLRLRFELKMGQREIARACLICQSTVHDYLKATRECRRPKASADDLRTADLRPYLWSF